jgi:hypothetical protein
MYQVIYGDFHGLGKRWILDSGTSKIPLHSGISPTKKNRTLIEMIVGFHIPNIEQAVRINDTMQPTETTFRYRGAIATLRADIVDALNQGAFN